MTTPARPTTGASQPQRPRPRWWRILAWLLGALLVFVLALGFWPLTADRPRTAAESHPGPQADAPAAPANPPAPRTIAVAPGGKIQAALDAASPGDTIVVPPGTYNETLTVRTYGLTLRGERGGAERPVLDGQGTFNNGVLAVGGKFTIEQFIVRNYTENGVIVKGADGVVFRDIVTENTGEYGLFPVETANVLIERCVASGATDTGLYVGQSRDIIIRDSEAFENVSGIEIENSVNALVENNYTHDNSSGVLIFLLPNHVSKENHHNIVRNNRIESNNRPNVAPPEEIVSQVPPGTGAFILAADDNEITGNIFKDNKSVGVAVINLRQALPNEAEFDVGIYSERNYIHGNTYINNGTNPDPAVLKAGLPGGDLLWDGTGADNVWDEQVQRRFPPLLPSSAWPAFASRAYMRVVSFVAGLL